MQVRRLSDGGPKPTTLLVMIKDPLDQIFPNRPKAQRCRGIQLCSFTSERMDESACATCFYHLLAALKFADKGVMIPPPAGTPLHPLGQKPNGIMTDNCPAQTNAACDVCNHSR